MSQTQPLLELSRPNKGQARETRKMTRKRQRQTQGRYKYQEFSPQEYQNLPLKPESLRTLANMSTYVLYDPLVEFDRFFNEALSSRCHSGTSQRRRDHVDNTVSAIKPRYDTISLRTGQGS